MYKVFTKSLPFQATLDFCQLHLSKLRIWSTLAMQAQHHSAGQLKACDLDREALTQFEYAVHRMARVLELDLFFNVGREQEDLSQTGADFEKFQDDLADYAEEERI